MTDAVPRPAPELADPKELLLGYLDYYRSVIARKLNGLTEAELRSSHLPSGWTPLELLKHLVHMEARWLRWGFMAEQLPQPWATRMSRVAGTSARRRRPPSYSPPCTPVVRARERSLREPS